MLDERDRHVIRRGDADDDRLMNQNECWSILQLEPTDDTRAIKRAYADALRTIDVDQDPAAFTALRLSLIHI